MFYQNMLEPASGADEWYALLACRTNRGDDRFRFAVGAAGADHNRRIRQACAIAQLVSPHHLDGCIKGQRVCRMVERCQCCRVVRLSFEQIDKHSNFDRRHAVRIRARSLCICERRGCAIREVGPSPRRDREPCTDRATQPDRCERLDRPNGDMTGAGAVLRRPADGA